MMSVLIFKCFQTIIAKDDSKNDSKDKQKDLKIKSPL